MRRIRPRPLLRLGVRLPRRPLRLHRHLPVGLQEGSGWTLTWSWPGNQQVTNAWNATVSQQGAQVTARNVPYNATIAAGTAVTFGFQATYSGTNSAPTQFALNGTACALAT
ncbi:cellulose binding domain-containing protein [Nonomuraea jabiensis]|uniref:cellulose binding domain-containing protein n=1 Tax=Nonomuraea jabiensis TaxID=882448 RepID=UPI003433F1ED